MGAMTESDQLDAAQLRARGIDHQLITDDDDLVAMVAMLREIGVTLDEMADHDLTFLAAPKLIRPDASIDPREVFSFDEAEAEFRAKVSVALGFNIDADTRLLTQAEVDAVTFFNELRVMLGDEEMLSMLRVMGTSMGRLARSVISSLRLQIETPIAEQSGSLAEIGHAYIGITQELLNPFLDATATVLRRHFALAAASPNTWNVDRSRSGTLEQITVGFVDLVGFTSFTEQANLKQFVDALTTFESEALQVIVTNGGTLVKLIGDEVMFVAPTPASGVEIARRLSDLSLLDGGPIAVRIGLSSGEVVAVGGDYYGTVVNIAARAVQQADPDTILVTAAVANGAHASARFEATGPRELRGISEPVELFRLL